MEDNNIQIILFVFYGCDTWVCQEWGLLRTGWWQEYCWGGGGVLNIGEWRILNNKVYNLNSSPKIRALQTGRVRLLECVTSIMDYQVYKIFVWRADRSGSFRVCVAVAWKLFAVIIWLLCCTLFLICNFLVTAMI
jgi:hypothetical protein